MPRRSILIVAPHPDDETLGCGGTLARHAEAGDRIGVVVLTDGRHLFRLSRWRIEVDPTPLQIAARRRAETERAVAILAGPQAALRFLEIEDAMLRDSVEPVAKTLAALLREAEPEAIYVTSEHEEHPDHVAACAAVRAAMRQAGSRATLYRYTIALRAGLSRGDVPERAVAIDVSAQLAKKRAAVSQFASHLQIVARGQAEPFFPSIEPWVQTPEVFFVDADPSPSGSPTATQ